MGKNTLCYSTAPTNKVGSTALLGECYPTPYMQVQGRQPSDTFCSPLTVLCHGNFQAGNKRFFWTDPMTLCESEKQKHWEQPGYVLPCSAQQPSFSIPPSAHTACRPGLLGALPSGRALSSTPLPRIRCLRLRSDQYKTDLKNCPSNELKLRVDTKCYIA